MQMNRFAVRRDSWMMTVAVLTLGLVLPAAAGAAVTKPEARTLGTSAITPNSATLSGTVNPHNSATTYLFQYGTTTLYGAETATGDAGKGNKRVAVNAPVAGLAPATKYHYRLVAHNRKGLVKGPDRTFTTKKQPLGLVLGATPNPVGFGKAATLSGQLTGTNNNGRQVQLQSNPFPYLQGFQNASNVQITDAAGNFAFPLASNTINTQYRVLMPQRPEVVSPILLLGVGVRVSTHVSDRHVHRGQRVRFSGRLRPAVDGTKVAIQRLKNGEWRTVNGTVAKPSGSGKSSRYSKRIRIRRGGKYRIFAGVEGQYSSNVGRTVRIHVRG
jgi:hypothetical protein